jgi:uncharacterized protein
VSVRLVLTVWTLATVASAWGEDKPVFDDLLAALKDHAMPSAGARISVADRAREAIALLQTAPLSQAAPLTVGDTFTIESKTLGERRRINVYAPPPYTQSTNLRLAVLYMPDGGIGEDFLHVAGLVQVLVGNQSMRPLLLVGIENTERRRDLTGPTRNAEDLKIAPRVGGSAAFRRFIRSELMPAINARYRTAPEAAIIGESLAGLFVVETLIFEPDLFDTYIAVDPSLWWNQAGLIGEAARPGALTFERRKTLYLASSRDDELARSTERLAALLRARAPANLQWHYEPMPTETHGTIYHPAALAALRRLFKPGAAADRRQ